MADPAGGLDSLPLRFPRSTDPKVPSRGEAMSSAAEQRAAAKRASERELLEAFAVDLGRKARQGPYAGIDQGDYVAAAIGAVFTGIALHIRDLPPQIVSDALSAAQPHLHGPAGQRDPRGPLPRCPTAPVEGPALTAPSLTARTSKLEGPGPPRAPSFDGGRAVAEQARTSPSTWPSRTKRASDVIRMEDCV